MKYKGWKGLKIDDPALYYLNISHNYFNWDHIKDFMKLFIDKIPAEFANKNNVPLQ